MSRFRRRLMGLAALRQAKADDFVRVEYIENTSNAYINVGIKGDNQISIDTKLEFTTNNKVMYIYGNRNKNATTSSNSYAYAYYIDINNYFSTNVRSSVGQYTDYEMQPNIKYRINGTARKTTVSYMGIDEETQQEVEKSFTFTNGGNNSGTYSQISYFLNINQQTYTDANATLAKVYYLKVYDNGELVRDYIPMYQISTDTYGLWDRVTEEFYTSPNRTKFNGGEQVIADANDNIYFYKQYVTVGRSSGQYFSINITPKGEDGFETKVYFNGTGRNYLMGSWASANGNSYGIRAFSSHLYRDYATQESNWDGTYSGKIFTWISDRSHWILKDANGNILKEVQGTDVSGEASTRVFQIGNFNGSSYGAQNNSRIYYFKYWQSGELVRDMIPVQSCDTLEYGMLDKVNLKIYYGNNPLGGA